MLSSESYLTFVSLSILYCLRSGWFFTSHAHVPFSEVFTLHFLHVRGMGVAGSPILWYDSLSISLVSLFVLDDVSISYRCRYGIVVFFYRGRHLLEMGS